MTHAQDDRLLAVALSCASSLSQDLLSALGQFSWQQRAHAAYRDPATGQTTVRFYSDGLSLDNKISVENILKQVFARQAIPDLIVYFERQKAPVTPPASPSSAAAPAASSQAPSVMPIEGVKHIVAVASGKGGVGKSTVTVNLAVALVEQGYKVGILDADIYGPSVPTMLDVHMTPVLNDSNKIVPAESRGIRVMSFGFFAPEDTAVIWRGPMIMKALRQFFWEVDWGVLDYLLIDLPPGTGDTQLTLVQSLPLSGAVIVTTPQNVALLDAVKGIAMFRKTSIPIIGVVENMSTYVCPVCKTESHIFGEGGALRVAEKFEVSLLGHVPLLSEIRAAGDLGEPLAAVSNHPVSVCFSKIAQKVVQGVGGR